MQVLPLILMVLGFVLFLLNAFRASEPPPPYRPHLLSLGLACWILAVILGPLLNKG